MDINKVVLVGRLVRDVEVKYTQANKAVARFTLAVNRSVKRGDRWENEASFFDMVMWGNEGLHRYLLKGKQVAVEGELNQNRWEQDGQNRSKVEIIVGNIQLLGGAKDGGSDGSRTSFDDFPNF
jgi:single-strand DNA-binding protein